MEETFFDGYYNFYSSFHLFFRQVLPVLLVKNGIEIRTANTQLRKLETSPIYHSITTKFVY